MLFRSFPGVALVGVLDADNGLFGADFRGPEHMGQLLIQVAGRAGRADVPGRVIIQTHFPDHPQLRRLIDEGYISYAGDLLAERRHYRLPPHCYMAVIRAESPHVGEGESVLLNCRKALRPMQNVLNALGPLPAALSRRADYHRSVLQLFANTRADLHRGVAAAIEQMDNGPGDRKSTRLNSSHSQQSRMPSSA